MASMKPLAQRALRAVSATVFAAIVLASLNPGTASAHEYKVGAIEVGHPWSRAMPPGARTGAGYLALANHGTEADRLVSASSPVADEVQIHEMSITDGVMTMRQVEGGVAIPAGGEAKLAPGGLHLMIMGVKQPFREGQMVPLDLVFENAGPVSVELKVDAMGSKGTSGAKAGTDGHEAHTH